MAGNGRFELSSASPDSGFGGNYPNGQRASYSGPSFDRCGSFRESNDSRMFGSGKGASRGGVTGTGDIPPLSQCLMLEPFVIGDHKYTKTVELRRALGFSTGSSSEDNSFAAAHLKASPSAATEELKRFRASVADSRVKASGRAKKLDEHLHKLNRYFEAMTPKKQQRNDLLNNDRSVASNLKMGTQINRSPSELVSPKFEDRPKNVILNKRVRTSVAETRADLRNNGFPRQPLTVTKDRDRLKDSTADPDVAEEKIRRLPIGGESWDKKMKRKRSVGAVCSRPNDNDTEVKRPIHQKLTGEPGTQSVDSQSLRSGACNSAAGMNKADGASFPANSNTRAMHKNEHEKPVISRDVASGLNKERPLLKANIKLNIREDNHNICSSPVTKGKASRAPRSGGTLVTNTASNITRVSGTLESWELSPGAVKNPSIGGVNSRKRPLPTGSSSPPITQWVGQRPQKISRTRRANLISPVSNHDEIQLPSEGCSPSEFGTRLTPTGANSSVLSKNAASATQNIKVKTESVSSPARISESEESGAVVSRTKEKCIGSSEVEDKAINNAPNVGPSAIIAKKNKLLIKDEVADGVRRQGWSGRVSSVSRASISPIREQLDNTAVNKPLRSIRPGSDKNGSKSGRPLKKLSDRKGFSRFGPANGGSPDFTAGESDDDREELIAAASAAYNSNLLACSSAFWKKFEPSFAPLSTGKKVYLSQQLKVAEDYHESVSHLFGERKDVVDDHMLENIPVLDTLSGERNGNKQIGLEDKDFSSKGELVDQFQNSISLAGVESGRIFDKMTPLYQRVLSALIVEDDFEELKDSGGRRCASHQNIPMNSPDEPHLHVDYENKVKDRLEFECQPNIGMQMQKNCSSNNFLSCNGYGVYGMIPNAPDRPCNGELSREDSSYGHSSVEVLDGFSHSDCGGPKRLQENGVHDSLYDCQYAQMRFEDKLLLELQSIGLYADTVPGLDDRDDEAINQEIVQLHRELYQQSGQKRMCLDKIHKVIHEVKDKDERDPEHIAMDRLVELAYKKLLATRGSLASKLGIPKVSKQVALAFARRTIARCWKFEESGVSCFNEPALRDIIFASPPPVYEADPLPHASFRGTSERASRDGFEPCGHQSDQAFAKNGPISNRGKKKEVLLDDVGSAAFRSSLGSSLLGGAKGKRSERDTLMKNGIAKGGLSLGNSKGERKTKTKPKQKTAQLSTSGNGYFNKFMEPTHAVYGSGSAEPIIDNGNRKRDVNLVSSGSLPPEPSKDKKDPMDLANLPLNDIDAIDELGVGADLVAPQDLNNWFNFDVDGLQDHDSVGLEIPMDDLSELNMF